MSRAPKFEALVVNAIRRLQAAQGSTASEIASYLSHEYDVGGPEVRKQIQQTIRKGVNYGILLKSKRLAWLAFAKLLAARSARSGKRELSRSRIPLAHPNRLHPPEAM